MSVLCACMRYNIMFACAVCIAMHSTASLKGCWTVNRFGMVWRAFHEQACANAACTFLSRPQLDAWSAHAVTGQKNLFRVQNPARCARRPRGTRFARTGHASRAGTLRAPALFLTGSQARIPCATERQNPAPILIELRAQRDNLSLQVHVIYKLAKIVEVVDKLRRLKSPLYLCFVDLKSA